MNHYFIMLISLSLSGSLLAIIVFALKSALKNRLSKIWQYYIWIIVLLRLILPFTPQTSLIGSLFHQSKDIISYPIVDNNIKNLNNTKNIEDNLNNNSDAAFFSHEKEYFLSIKENLWFIWFIVFLVLLAHKITSYNNFLRFVKVGRIRVTNPIHINIVNQVYKNMGIRNTIPLYENPLIASPMLVGMFRSFILIPNTNIGEIELYQTIAHEILHYRRLDSIYKWIAQIVVCIHWFNPIVYFVYNDICRQCELSCDEMLIRNMDADEKRQYGTTLISSIRREASFNDNIAPLSLNEDAKLLKERLGAIMNYKRISKPMLTTTIILTIAIFFSAIAAGAYVIKEENLLTNQFAKNSEIPEKTVIEIAQLYGKYGISSKDNALFYYGEQVQQLIDGGSYYQGGGYWCDTYYNNQSNNGTIYLHVIRGKKGQIKGLEVMSADMLIQLFGQNRVLNYQPNFETASQSTEEMFQLFSKYGLNYNKITDTVFYKKQEVKAFVDGGSKYGKSGYWFNITYYNEESNSSLYLCSVRDKDGVITGIKKMSQKMIKNYYGKNGLLLSMSDKGKYLSGQVENDRKKIFESANLPELPDKINKYGDYYYHVSKDNEVQAVAKWRGATGTINLAEFTNNINTLDKGIITIAYEIKVYNGNFDFIHDTSQGSNILVRESIAERSLGAAYDHHVFQIDITDSENIFAFVCENADIDIRVIVTIN